MPMNREKYYETLSKGLIFALMGTVFISSPYGRRIVKTNLGLLQEEHAETAPYSASSRHLSRSKVSISGQNHCNFRFTGHSTVKLGRLSDVFSVVIFFKNQSLERTVCKHKK